MAGECCRKSLFLFLFTLWLSRTDLILRIPCFNFLGMVWIWKHHVAVSVTMQIKVTQVPHQCSAALSSPAPSINEIKLICSCLRSLRGHVELAWLGFVACWVLGFFIFYIFNISTSIDLKRNPNKKLCSLFKAGKSCFNKNHSKQLNKECL